MQQTTSDSDFSVSSYGNFMIEYSDTPEPKYSIAGENTKKYNTYNTYYLVSEKSLSIMLHILIMVCFITYFYFNYIIIIEKKLFLQKIQKYFNNANNEYNNFNTDYQLILTNAVDQFPYENEYLYNKYITSQAQQQKKLDELFYKSMIMITSVFLGFLITFINCLFIRKQIRWKVVIIENLIMVLLLGTVEYLFFTNIVLQYSPITDEELEYISYNNVVKIVNGTY